MSPVPVLAFCFVGLVTRRPWLCCICGAEGLPDQESPGSTASKSVTRLLSVYLPGQLGPSVTWVPTAASLRGRNPESSDKWDSG